MKRMKIILNHFIAIALLLLTPGAVLCCEKELPLIIEDSERVFDIDRAVYKTDKIGAHVWVDENLIREAIIPEEWGQADIEYDPAWSYNNNDSENRGNPGKQDNWYVVYNSVGLDVFLVVHAVIAVSFLIMSGLMTYKIIHDNPVKNLKDG